MLALPDPFALAERQIALDHAIMTAGGQVLARKQRKLTASPLGFFRGSARLFYEIVGASPALALTGGPRGWVVGDMHLENVGAYRTDDDAVAFDLNDFDDATVAPQWVDTLRLATSVLLAGRTFQASAVDALALVTELLTAYEAAFAGGSAPPLPKPIEELCERAKKRTRKELLDLRAPLSHGRRTFVRGERYSDLSPAESDAMPRLIDSYRRALGRSAPAHTASWRLIDAAARIAGTGSLGRHRYAFVVADEDGTERIFELKEAVPASLEALGETSAEEPAARVVGAARALVVHPPRQLVALGETEVGSLIGRKLCPEEDKLDLSRLTVGPKLSAVVRVVGDRLGRAHARAASSGAAPPIARDALIDRAIALAGIFEAVYLAYARRVTGARA